MKLLQKYSPKTLDEIILDEKTMDSIISWTNSWLQGFPNMQKPAILLYGKPGTGKTLTSRSLANDCEWSIVELNASSIRTKDQLQTLFKIPPYDFFGRKTCLFLDEADSQEGGETILKKVIMQMQFPVILSANDLYKVPKILRDISETVQFFRPSVKSLKQYLLKINKEEGLCLPMEIIDSASELQDYRAAFQVLESRQILKQKEKKISLADITKNLFSHTETNIEDTKSLLYYIDENASKYYDMLDLYEIYETLYKVDKYNRRNQHNFSNQKIKEIPQTPKEIENIQNPVYYEKLKYAKKKETT